MSESLFIFAEIKPKPEHFKDAQQAITDIFADTHAETGCLSLDLFEAPNQDTLYLFEEWADQNALDQHHDQPYSETVFKVYEGWLAEPPRIVHMHSVK